MTISIRAPESVVSIDVAAHLIQVLTDKPLRDFLRERIFSPLGMVDTDFWVPYEERARMVTMYADDEMVAAETILSQLVEDRESVRSVRLDIGGLPTPGYGFGLGSRSLMDVGAAGVLGSVGEFGWSGAASTYYWVDPQEKLVGIFMTQYQGIEEPDRRFRTLVYQAIVD